MAVLPDADRRDLWAQWMRLNDDPTGTLTKSDLRAVFDALDTFMSNNETTINQAIPQPGRSGLTSSQKAWILTKVVERRYIKGV